MSEVTHQTVRLSKGKHQSPDSGACVMELASMLAGEPFSDHPASVCPVIGAFLRAYNDSIGDERRQDLYAYAAKVVGSRGSQELQDARRESLRAWTAELRSRRPTRSWFSRVLHALDPPPADSAGAHAVHAILAHHEDVHAEVLALIDELLTLEPPAVPEREATEPSTSMPVSTVPSVR